MAVETLKRAVTVLPERAPLADQVGSRLWALSQMDDKKEARRVIDQAIEINPLSEDARMSKDKLFPSQSSNTDAAEPS